MAYKTVETKTVQLSEKYSVRLSYVKTNYGFKHEAVAMEDWRVLGKTKAIYYNRTWECYEYQTVICQAIKAFIPSPEKEVLHEHFSTITRLPGEGKSFLDSVCAMAKAFEVIAGDDKETTAKFQKKFLEKVPGIDFPEGFDELPLEERERRLKGAIDFNLDRQ